MLQLSLQPMFHLFNSVLPSLATFMVLSAFLSALPNFGKKASPQMQRATSGRILRKPVTFVGMKRQPVASTQVKAYSIPTSMRPRTSRNY